MPSQDSTSNFWDLMHEQRDVWTRSIPGIEGLGRAPLVNPLL